MSTARSLVDSAPTSVSMPESGPELSGTVLGGTVLSGTVLSGTVFWVTGLAGAGKTTIGRILFERLRASRGPGVVFLDGDVLRQVMGATVAHTANERRQLAQRYSRFCQMLAKQGLDVVCCTISLFHEVHAWNRANLAHYREIFIRVPLTVLRVRDQKGLYSLATRQAADQLVGIHLAAEYPKSPDLEVQNDGCRPPELVVDEIWQALFPKPQEPC